MVDIYTVYLVVNFKRNDDITLEKEFIIVTSAIVNGTKKKL